MLTLLPVETVLQVLSFIPLRQLQRLQLVSREWLAFFKENEASIYHAAAILHGFVTSHASIPESKTTHVPWLADVQTWKDLCKKHYVMESRWDAKNPAKYTSIGPRGETIHRFKIDTEQRTVITTYFGGGLRVSAIDEDEPLWVLPRSAVHSFAHCEFDGGFLVFTRVGEALEVWRRKRDALTHPRPSGLNPDLHQQNAHQLSWRSSSSISQNDRGAFVPWTLIVPPGSVRALRLVFPLLLTASHTAQEAYVYDVVTGKLTETIPLRRPQDPPVKINYVELGARHILVCTETDVLIIPRDPRHAALRFPSQLEDFRGLCTENLFTLHQFLGDDPMMDSTAPPTLDECRLETPRPVPSAVYAINRTFTAVHVSPCGSHFVAADMKGCLYVVRDFEKAIRGTLPLSHCVTVLYFVHPITYLALHEDTRICVHVKGRGMFVVPFASPNAVSVDTLDMRPQRSYPRLLHANRVGTYDLSPCIQLTRTELWTKNSVNTGVEVNKLYYLDFTQPQ